MIEILECKCGDQPMLITEGSYVYIYCNKCFRHTAFYYGDDKEYIKIKAIKNWNIQQVSKYETT